MSNVGRFDLISETWRGSGVLSEQRSQSPLLAELPPPARKSVTLPMVSSRPKNPNSCFPEKIKMQQGARRGTGEGGEVESHPPPPPAPSLDLPVHSSPPALPQKEDGLGSPSTRGPSAGSGSRKIEGAQKNAQKIASENSSVSQIGTRKNAIV